MITGIDRSYIQTALDELIRLLGIKGDVDRNHLVSLVKSQKLEECFKEIARQLSLPIDIKVNLVSRNRTTSTENKFQSTNLVKTDLHGRGSSGIVAQVTIPPDLPLFGSSQLVNFPIYVSVGKDCFNFPLSLITVMAHELSHVLLHSLRHREKENEIYTDLTPIVLGFAEVVKAGRKTTTESVTEHHFVTNTRTTHTETTTYGYLSDENFGYAYNRITAELSRLEEPKREIIVRLKAAENHLKDARKQYTILAMSIQRLANTKKRNIPVDDAMKIGAFFSNGYIEDYRAALHRHSKNIESINARLHKITHYTDSSIRLIEGLRAPLSAEELKISALVNGLRADANLAICHIGFFLRLRIKRIKTK